MRAIIIQDDDAANLLDLLKLEKFKDTTMYRGDERDAWHSLPENTRNQIIGTIHQKFHYVVCRWLDRFMPKAMQHSTLHAHGHPEPAE